MAISQSLITNLSLSSFGLATIGGIVYGSYELLKDVDKPVSELLQIKQRTLLTFEVGNKEDDAHWLTNWSQYVDDNAPPLQSPDSAQVPLQTETKKDIWELVDWEKHSKDKAQVPLAFKNTCQSKSSNMYPGIWNTTFKQIIKYCTKPTPEEI